MAKMLPDRAPNTAGGVKPIQEAGAGKGTSSSWLPTAYMHILLQVDQTQGISHGVCEGWAGCSGCPYHPQGLGGDPDWGWWCLHLVVNKQEALGSGQEGLSRSQIHRLSLPDPGQHLHAPLPDNATV